MASFTAQINAWTRKSNQRIEVVFKQSAQEVVNEANRPVAQGGNLPFDTGFLHASMQTSINSAPSGDVSESRSASQMQAELTLNLANLQIGDTLWAVWGANYARRLHYGFSGQDSLGRNYDQKGFFWVTKAAQQWQSIVRRVAAEAQRRFP